MHLWNYAQFKSITFPLNQISTFNFYHTNSNNELLTYHEIIAPSDFGLLFGVYQDHLNRTIYLCKVLSNKKKKNSCLPSSEILLINGNESYICHWNSYLWCDYTHQVWRMGAGVCSSCFLVGVPCQEGVHVVQEVHGAQGAQGEAHPYQDGVRASCLVVAHHP